MDSGFRKNPSKKGRVSTTGKDCPDLSAQSFAMSRILLRPLVLVCLLALAVAASGADPRKDVQAYWFDFWDESDGLPQSRIRDIVQTKDGYLWLGTDGGLIRFNGATFTPFNIQTGDLKDNEVRSLKEDSEGRLWIATFGGGLTVLKHGRFTTFTMADGLPDDAIRFVDVDREGNIWYATSTGAGRFSRGVFTTFHKKDGLASDYVTGICAGSRQGIFAIAGNKLHRFVDGRFVVEDGVVGAGNGRLSSLSAGGDGSLWITFDAGTVKKLLNGTVTSYATRSKLGLESGRVYEDPSGKVWLGSPEGVRRLMDGRFGLVSSKNADSRLGTVYCMVMDREGSLWLGLEARGLARLKPTRFTTLSKEDGLPEDSTRSVFEDREGNLWVGTTSGLVKLGRGTPVQYSALEGSKIPRVTAIAEDADGGLWFGAGGELLKIKDGLLAPDRDWEQVPDIRSIYRDHKGRMWIGTDGDGLYEIHGGKVTAYRTREGLPSNQIRGLLEDRQGALWITTFAGGVSRFAGGKFTNYTVKDGLGSDRVGAVHEEEDGSLWFATRQGLSRFKDGSFFTFRVEDGLYANHISAILGDGRGNLWFSCATGIFHVSLADLNDFAAGKKGKVQSTAYGIRDGMATTAFAAGYQPNAWKTRDGRLLFASLKGLVAIDPRNLFSNGNVPPVYIETVLIDKRTERPDQDAIIRPGAREVEIRYAALSYTAPERVRFRYRLEGFDKEWVDAGTRRFAYYASLPPGQYRFHVIACNNDGIWNEAGATFSFHLKPHFYQTRGFFLLCLTALMLFAGAAYRLRVRRLLTLEKELRRRVDEALAKVKILSGLLPVCANCKKVRDDKGYWSQIEQYIREHSDTRITHGICPDCLRKLYPEFADDLPETQPPPPHP